MKRYYFLFLAALVLLGGCEKIGKLFGKKGKDTDHPEAVLISEDPSVPLAVILTDASLMEKKDGKMAWKANISAGDTVIWKDEKEDAPRAYDGQVRTFYRVEMDGDYWVQDYAIAGPAKPGVITKEETILYTKPDITSVAKRGNVSVPKYALVAVLDEYAESGGFVKITARIEGTDNPAVTDLYVKSDNVSLNINDIGAVKITRAASTTKNSTARKELLKNAMQLTRESRYFSNVAFSFEDDPALFELELTDNLDKDFQGANYTITADKINVREFPSVDSKSVGTLNAGDSVWVTMRTKKIVNMPVKEGEEPVKGLWLRPDHGGNWFFGGYATQEGGE